MTLIYDASPELRDRIVGISCGVANDLDAAPFLISISDLLLDWHVLDNSWTVLPLLLAVSTHEPDALVAHFDAIRDAARKREQDRCDIDCEQQSRSDACQACADTLDQAVNNAVTDLLGLCASCCGCLTDQIIRRDLA